MPPESVVDGISEVFLPAPEIATWVLAEIIQDGGRLYNQDHGHLKEAHIGFLWTNVPYTRQMIHVAGTAEIPLFRCGAWQRSRQELQLREWFGEIPDFLITLDACYAATVSDATWSALVEHELYHCAQAQDDYGAPKFSKDGRPKFCIRGHDVEEFVGVVRRYGAGNASGATAKLVEAAKRAPEVAQIDIARACGTCQLRVA